ncbi:MAG TPA: hypothetical protein VHZ73_13610 [Vicinamibacterales bacterium]|jgi:hypothetical protein|nr:hypothetical protein [Vicinamibacterales bacterium]
MSRRTPVFIATAALLVILGAALSFSSRRTVPARASVSSLPDKITDKDFWQLVETMSEPNGFFRSDNLLSNEDTFQYVIPDLERRLPQGGVYLGVGPDQNFTYIEALHPKMAFVLDIRRQNMLEHLMYKAILELSADRIDFLSMLFSRPAPENVTPDSPPEELFRAFSEAVPSGGLFRRNLQTITDRLTKEHGFTLTSDDTASLEYVYRAFFSSGPDLRYSFPRGGFGGGARGFPSYAELMMATDQAGVNHGYLANNNNFQVLRSYELNNLLVPITGDFAGPKALRSVGEYLAQHGAALTLFYTSNVEQYLFQSDDQWRRFYGNLATIPTVRSATLLRSYFNMGGFRVPQTIGPQAFPSRSSMLTDSIPDLLGAVRDGRVRSYYDVIARAR